MHAQPEEEPHSFDISCPRRTTPRTRATKETLKFRDGVPPLHARVERFGKERGPCFAGNVETAAKIAESFLLGQVREIERAAKALLAF